jgi:hypothetical protein
MSDQRRRPGEEIFPSGLLRPWGVILQRYKSGFADPLEIAHTVVTRPYLTGGVLAA